MRKLTRREFLCGAELAAAGMVLAACAPAATPQVIKEIVKETVIVEGTPKVVEKVVEQTVVVRGGRRAHPPGVVARLAGQLYAGDCQAV